MLTSKANITNHNDKVLQPILSDNDDSSSNSSLDNIGADLNEDLNVVEESFEEESTLMNQNNQSNCENKLEVDEPHNVSNNLISLPSRYNKETK